MPAQALKPSSNPSSRPAFCAPYAIFGLSCTSNGSTEPGQARLDGSTRQKGLKLNLG
jgi:hypothetical protein